jgi:WD40 repeat protein
MSDWENNTSQSKIIMLPTAEMNAGNKLDTLEYVSATIGAPVSGPRGKWLVQGPIDLTIGVGATLPWSSWMPYTSTLDGRGFILWGGGGGGGGGIGSFKVDYAVDLLKIQPEPADERPSPIPLRGHESQVRSLLISPDEQWVLTVPSDSNEQLRLWNTERMSLDPNTRPVLLPRLSGEIKSVGFTADSRWLVIVTNDNTIHFWSTQPDDLIAQACQAVGRNLIINEWERYFPVQDYRQTCPNLPVHPSVQDASGGQK